MVIFSFSEAPVGFAIGDISPTNGTITNLVQDTATTWHATFTANAGFEGQGSVTVNAATFRSEERRVGKEGRPHTVTNDTRNPTVSIDIVATALSEGTPSRLVRFTLGEARVGFAFGDISPTNGTITTLVQDTATTWHATFTANAGFEGQGSVTVNAATF